MVRRSRGINDHGATALSADGTKTCPQETTMSISTVSSQFQRIRAASFAATAALCAVAMIAFTQCSGARRQCTDSEIRKCLAIVYEGERTFKRSGEIDQDSDGVGEYGFLQELAGDFLPPASRSPYIPRSYGRVDADGVLHRDGVCMKVFLPGPPGEILEEKSGVIPSRAPGGCASREQAFVVYAWSESSSEDTELYVMNQHGAIFHRLVTRSSFGPKGYPAYDYGYYDSDGNGKIQIQSDQPMGTSSEYHYWELYSRSGD